MLLIIFVVCRSNSYKSIETICLYKICLISVSIITNILYVWHECCLYNDKFIVVSLYSFAIGRCGIIIMVEGWFIGVIDLNDIVMIIVMVVGRSFMFVEFVEILSFCLLLFVWLITTFLMLWCFLNNLI